MLDLNKITSECYEIKWFDETILHIKRPNQQLLQNLFQISTLDYDSNLEKIYGAVNELLFAIFNNNKDGRTFTKEEIEQKFDFETAMIVIEDYANETMKELGK